MDATNNRSGDGRLSLVSSSPDFSREYAQDLNDDLPSKITVLSTSDMNRARGQRSHYHRPVTMFIDQDEDVLVNDVAEHVETRRNERKLLQNQSTGDDETGPEAGPTGEKTGSSDETPVTNSSVTGTSINQTANSAKEQCPPGNLSASKHKNSRTDRVASSSLSVRVITQSKSCNNIRYSDKNTSPSKDIVQSNGNGSPGGKKLPPSSLIRRNKDDKKDCCIIT